MRKVNTICNYPDNQEMSDSDFFEIFLPIPHPDGLFEDEDGNDDFDEEESLDNCLEMHYDPR